LPEVRAIPDLGIPPRLGTRKTAVQKQSTILKGNIMVKKYEKQKKHPIISAVAGIEVLKDAADAAGIILDKRLSPRSLALWTSVVEDLYDSMDGTAIGVMIALIVEISHKGHTLNDIASIEIDPMSNGMALHMQFHSAD
jgi:hypothetical protein